MHPLQEPTFSGKLLMGLTMLKNCFIFILALIIFVQYASATDWAGDASRTKEYSFPNLVNSPSLPPYKDVIGGGGPSTPAADADAVPPPPPYCVYPPPAKPAMPAPLPPVASPPGAPPSPSAVSPSIAPGISPPPMPGASPPAGSPSIVAPGSSAPPQPLFMPPVAFPAPPPGQAVRRGMWCVANPKVASAVVQTAMDYACGSGADCGMAAPGGPCYLPDTLTSHASYAFNSYWQRTKATGGTCDFAGTAMLVTRDPSYEGCKYVSM
ncbi:hypothetical protein SEVIR_4G153900v4 [Setaria viridis]